MNLQAVPPNPEHIETLDVPEGYVAVVPAIGRAKWHLTRPESVQVTMCLMVVERDSSRPTVRRLPAAETCKNCVKAMRARQERKG